MIEMPVFTPDNEPYLGRESVLWFDKMIIETMELNQKIAPWTHGKNLSSLQQAVIELAPHGFSIALSIRELVRQGYLISAEVLLRPLIERAAVLSYLCETPNAIALWNAGWPYKSRPPLHKMLAAMVKPQGDKAQKKSEEVARQITTHFNAIVHADPMGSRQQSIKLITGRHGYTASKSLQSPEKCDEICIQAQSYMLVIRGRAVEIFPDI